MTAAEDGAVSRTLWERLQEWIRRLGHKPKIGLALGTGGAWGVAHIGVLSVFHELEIPISYLAGCSAGAFVGSLYAGGIEGAALESCGRTYGWRDAGRLRVPPTMGLASNERMATYLKKRIGEPRFDQLRLPFFVVATNLVTGQRKIFKEGPVIPAVRASSAIPGVFEPVEIDGELYCDGGLVDRVPCDVLRAAGAAVVIGVDLGRHEQSWRPHAITEVIGRAIEIVTARQGEDSVKSADLLIRPSLIGMSEFNFDRNEILLKRGRQAALEQLTQWHQLHTPISETSPNPEISEAKAD
ncbi:MAG TPA: patatin-like phospholipase family protein [Nitrospiria bacterium]|nr:patatin-like phospholipase family protein [Nitrospiria bacterium]